MNVPNTEELFAMLDREGQLGRAGLTLAISVNNELSQLPSQSPVQSDSPSLTRRGRAQPGQPPYKPA
jgi:hypothetical protein